MGGTRCVVVMAERKLVSDVVDNGGQWTHREWRMLRYLGVDTQIIDNTTPLAELRELDGLILSGGAARIGLSGELGSKVRFIFLAGPNILSGSSADLSDSIYEDINY